MKKKILVLFLLSTMVLGGCSTQKNTDSSSQKEEAQEAKNQDISEESTDGEADESQEASKDVFAMDTYMTVTAYGSHGEEAVEKAATEIERLDGLLSTGEESSEIAQVNANGGGTLGKDASYLVERALEFGESEHLTLQFIRLWQNGDLPQVTSKFLLKRHWMVFWKKRNYRMLCLIKKPVPYLLKPMEWRSI